jgi:nucleoside-diphosphate-sugar epimerase
MRSWTSPPEPPSQRSGRILRAEALSRAHAAAVLRASAIYGPDSGLHMRMIRGEHKLPGDGSPIVTRIHVDDLAAFALAAAERARGETFVIATRSRLGTWRRCRLFARRTAARCHRASRSMRYEQHRLGAPARPNFIPTGVLGEPLFSGSAGTQSVQAACACIEHSWLISTQVS